MSWTVAFGKPRTINSRKMSDPGLVNRVGSIDALADQVSPGYRSAAALRSNPVVSFKDPAMLNQSFSPPRVGEEKHGLLRRRLIFGDPERSIVRLSRNGTRLAFRAPVDGVLNLLVAPLDRIDDACPITAVTDRNLGPWILWMHDNRHVVFFGEAAGDKIGARGGSILKNRRCAATDAGTWGDMLHSAKLAPFS